MNRSSKIARPTTYLIISLFVMALSSCGTILIGGNRGFESILPPPYISDSTDPDIDVALSGTVGYNNTVNLLYQDTSATFAQGNLTAQWQNLGKNLTFCGSASLGFWGGQVDKIVQPEGTDAISSGDRIFYGGIASARLGHRYGFTRSPMVFNTFSIEGRLTMEAGPYIDTRERLDGLETTDGTWSYINTKSHPLGFTFAMYPIDFSATAGFGSYRLSASIGWNEGWADRFCNLMPSEVEEAESTREKVDLVLAFAFPLEFEIAGALEPAGTNWYLMASVNLIFQGNRNDMTEVRGLRAGVGYTFR